jgi:hypothetical protein
MKNKLPRYSWNVCGNDFRAPELNPPVNKRDLSTGANGENQAERAPREASFKVRLSLSAAPGETRESQERIVGDNHGGAGDSMLSTKPGHQFVIRSLGSPKPRFSESFSQDSLMFLGPPKTRFYNFFSQDSLMFLGGPNMDMRRSASIE